MTSDSGSTTPEDEFSDQSTISSYASSVTSISSSEELGNAYSDYLEKPIVNVKSAIKHSEFGHCNNPNWRWTSQVSHRRVLQHCECPVLIRMPFSVEPQ